MMMSVGIVSIDILTGYCGLVIYAAYHGCDPVISKVSKRIFNTILL